MKVDLSLLQELLRVVAATEPSEIDCDEFLARVSAYLEYVDIGGETAVDLRIVRQHLEICGECQEEFEALVALHMGA